MPGLTLSEQWAGRAVDYALTAVPLPANAHAASPVSGVTRSEAAPTDPSVHRIAWYATTSQPTEVARWGLAHGYAGGWDESMDYSTDRSSGDLAPLGQVQNVDSPAPILQVTVQRHEGGSILGVDGRQRLQPLVARDPATLIGPPSSVDVARGSDGTAAYSSTLTLTVTGARVAALAG